MARKTFDEVMKELKTEQERPSFDQIVKPRVKFNANNQQSVSDQIRERDKQDRQEAINMIQKNAGDRSQEDYKNLPEGAYDYVNENRKTSILNNIIYNATKNNDRYKSINEFADVAKDNTSTLLQEKYGMDKEEADYYQRNWNSIKGNKEYSDKQKEQEEALSKMDEKEYELLKTYSKSKSTLNFVTDSRIQMQELQERQNAKDELKQTYGLSDEEIAKYADYVSRDANKKYNEKIKEDAAEVAKNPAGKVGLSAISSALSPIAGLASTANTALSRVSGKPVDVYDDSFLANNIKDISREAVSDTIENPIANFIYNASMSFLDSRATIALGRNISSYFGLGAKASELLISTMTSASFGTNAFSSTLRDSIESGKNENQAVAYALASGINEGLWEALSVENLLKTGREVVTKPQIIKAMLKQAGFEFSEEINTDIANMIADRAINGDYSDYNMLQYNYEQNGYSPEEAKKLATIDTIKQIFLDGLAGAFAGFLGGGVEGFKNYHTTNRLQKGASDETIKKAVDAALNSETSKGTVAQEIAQKVSDGTIKAEDLSGEERRQLLSSLAQSSGSEIDDVINAALEQSIENEDTLNKAKALFNDYRNSRMTDQEFEKRLVNDVAKNSKERNAILQVKEDIESGKIALPINETVNQAEIDLQNYNQNEENNNIIQENAENLQNDEGILQEDNNIIQDEAPAEEKTVSRENAVVDANSGETLRIKAVENVNGLKTVFKTQDGSKVKFSDLQFNDSKVAELYNQAISLPSKELANIALQNYNGQLNVEGYVRALKLAYESGQLSHKNNQTEEGFISNLKNASSVVTANNEVAIREAFKSGYTSVNVQPSVAKTYDVNRAKIEKSADEILKSQGTLSKTIAATASAQDVTVEMTENIKNNRGEIVRKIAGSYNNGKSQLNKEASNLYATMVHELIGEKMKAEDPEGYKEVSKALLDYMIDTYGNEYVLNQLNEYSIGYKLAKESGEIIEVADEYINDCIAGLYMTPEGIRDFANDVESKNKSKAAQIFEFIKNLAEEIINEITNYLSENRVINIGVKDGLNIEKQKAQQIRDMISKKLDALENNQDEFENFNNEVTEAVNRYAGKSETKVNTDNDLLNRMLETSKEQIKKESKYDEEVAELELEGDEFALDDEEFKAKYGFEKFDSKKKRKYLKSIQKKSFSVDVDSEGNTLSEQQINYFKDSVVRDKNGNLKVVYHGTAADFTIFDYKKIGKTGSAEGYGFYFTDSYEKSSQYADGENGKVLKGYLKIEKPLYYDKLTIKRNDVKNIIKRIDSSGDLILSSYDSSGIGYPSKAWYERALNDTLDALFEYNDTDVDLIANIVNDSGDKAVLKTIKEVTGYDGIIADKKYDNAEVYVTFESNQFKNIDNLNPTDNQDIRYSVNVYGKDYDYLTDILGFEKYAAFKSEIDNHNKNKYLKSSNGDAIVPIENMLIFTNFNKRNIGVSAIIVINSDNYNIIDAAFNLYKIHVLQGGLSFGKFRNIYEGIFGEGTLTRVINSDFGYDEKYDYPTKRGKQRSDAYHAQKQQLKQHYHFGDSEEVFSIEVDSEGNKLSEQQQEFFKDSKARDDNGKLRVFYHGTNSDEFNIFDMSYLGSGSGDIGFFGKGFYFAFNKDEAKYYGKKVLDVYLNTKKPYYFSDELGTYKGKSSMNEGNRAIFVTNFVNKFPELAKNFTVDAWNNEGDYTPISFKEFAKQFEKIYSTKKFEITEKNDDYSGEAIYVVTADTKEESVTLNDGTIYKWNVNAYETEFNNKKDASDQAFNAYKYLNDVVYNGIKIPNFKEIIIQTEFSEAVKKMGYDSIFQDKNGDEVLVFDSNQIKRTDNTAPTDNQDIRFSVEIDNDYLEAVKNNDIEKADKLVREYAISKGYNSPMLYTGHTKKDINTFESVDNIFFTSDNEDVAKSYALITDYYNIGRVYKVYGKTSNMAKVNAAGNSYMNVPLPSELSEYYKLNDFIISDDEIYSARDIADMYSALKYDGVIIKNIEDTNNIGKQIIANDYIYFKTNHFKSAETVEYDDDGNIIPLSKRFNDEISDRRFSVEIDDLALFEEIIEENEQLNEANNIIKNTVKNAADLNIKPADIKKIASAIKAEYKTQTSIDDITDSLTSVFNYMKQDNVNYDALVQIMSEIAKPILENATVTTSTRSASWDKFREHLINTKFRLSPAQVREVISEYGSTENYRKKLFGVTTVSSDAAMSLDEMWSELVDASGNALPALVEDTNQPEILLQTINGLRPQSVTENAYGMNLEEASYDLALDIYRRFFEAQALSTKNQEIATAVGKVKAKQMEYRRKSVETYKKKLAEQRKLLEAEKQRNMKALAEELRSDDEALQNALKDNNEVAAAIIQDLKNKNNARIEQIRHQKNEEIAKIKAKNFDSRQAERDRRKNTVLKEQIRNQINSLNKMLKSPNVAGFVKPSMVKGTIEVLEAINIDTGKSQGLRDKLQKLSELYNQYKGDNTFDFDYDESTAAMIIELRNTFEDRNYTELSGKELSRVLELVTRLKKQIQNASKLINDEKYSKAADCALDVIKEVNESKGSLDSKLSKEIDKFFSYQLNAYRWFRKTAGYKNGALMNIYNQLDKGQMKMIQMQKEINEMFAPLLEGKENQENVKRLTSIDEKDMVDIGLKIDGKAVKVTRGMMLSYLMHIQNEDNARHMVVGGFSVPDMKAYKDGKYADAFEKTNIGHFFTYDELKQAAENIKYNKKDAGLDDGVNVAIKTLQNKAKKLRKGLSEWELSYLETAEKLFHEYYGQKINEVSVETKGYALAQVKNYFPINTEKKLTRKDFTALKKDGSLEGMGFTKERVKASNPIMLEDIAQVILRQTDNTSRYYGFSIPVRNVNMVMNMKFNNSTTPETAISSKWGKFNLDLFQAIMQDVQTGRGTDSKESKIFTALRGNFAAATLTANIGVAMKQAASYPTAAAVLGWKAIGKAFNDIPKGLTSKGIEELEAINPLLWYRSKGQSSADINYAKQSDIYKYLENNHPLAKAVSVDLIQNIDSATVRTLEYASKYYVDDNFTELEKGSEEYWNKVSEVFTKVIEETQPNYTVLQRPEVLKSTNDLVRQLFMFKTQPLQNFGIIYDSLGEFNVIKKKYKKDSKEYKNAVDKVSKAVSSQIVAAAVFSLMTICSNVIYHKLWKYDQDDEKSAWLEALLAFLGGMASTLSGMILCGDWIYNSVSDLLFGTGNYGVEVSIVSNFNNIYNYINNYKTYGEKLIDAKTESEREKAIKKLLQNSEDVVVALGQYFGVPVNNIKNSFVSPILYIKDIVNDVPIGSSQLAWDESTDSQYMKMFDALLSENTERYNKLRAEYISSSTAENPEKNADKKMKDLLKEAYNKDELSADQVLNYLNIAGIEYDKDDIVKGWEYTKETGNSYTQYAPLKDAIDNSYSNNADRKLIKQEIDKLFEAGKTKSQIASTITNKYKAVYLENKSADLKNLLITCYMYCGYTRDEAVKKINEWE